MKRPNSETSYASPSDRLTALSFIEGRTTSEWLHSGVNPVSGDFSTGAEGLRISGGSLGEPLREFTIASTLQRMLADVAAVGADIEWLPDPGRTPDQLHIDGDMRALYDLIWKRAMASQMSAAEMERTTIDLHGGRAVRRLSL